VTVASQCSFLMRVKPLIHCLKYLSKARMKDLFCWGSRKCLVWYWVTIHTRDKLCIADEFAFTGNFRRIYFLQVAPSYTLIFVPLIFVHNMHICSCLAKTSYSEGSRFDKIHPKQFSIKCDGFIYISVSKSISHMLIFQTCITIKAAQ
jgi:hypothetical protein